MFEDAQGRNSQVLLSPAQRLGERPGEGTSDEIALGFVEATQCRFEAMRRVNEDNKKPRVHEDAGLLRGHLSRDLLLGVLAHAVYGSVVEGFFKRAESGEFKAVLGGDLADAFDLFDSQIAA